jgi:Tol biopolymer transport system component
MKTTTICVGSVCATLLAVLLSACGGGGGTPPGTSAVVGSLRAPVGASVTLRNNGGDALALTEPAVPTSTDRYNTLDFSFATALATGAAYAVTIASQPADQSCSVYKGAAGTVPIAAGALKVGCEFLHDHVSRSSNDSVLGTYFESTAPAVGGDAVYGEGRFVAFVSSTVGLGGSTGGRRQIYWRDRRTGETRLISSDATGTEGNGDSFAPAISADGLTVAFESYATNLVAADTNGVRDVFVWSFNAASPGVTRASVGTAGVQANGESYAATLSGNGKVVAFASSASNLTDGVTGNSTVNVVRRDLTAGSNVLVTRGSVGAGTGIGVGGSMPALSEDGNRLAFWSFSAQLVAGDGNGLWDIFVYQHDTSALTRVSLAAGGGERNQGNDSTSRVVAPAISGNGRYVAYATTATNVVAGDTNAAQDVFVVDLDGGLTVQRASVATSGTQGNGDSPVGQGERPALSADGTWIAFTSAASNLGAPANNVILHNLLTGETRAASSGSNGVGVPALSRSAAYVVFGSPDRLDGRFASSGLFATFTGLARAWWWID